MLKLHTSEQFCIIMILYQRAVWNDTTNVVLVIYTQNQSPFNLDDLVKGNQQRERICHLSTLVYQYIDKRLRYLHIYNDKIIIKNIEIICDLLHSTDI